MQGPDIRPDTQKVIDSLPEDILLTLVKDTSGTNVYVGWKHEWIARCAQDPKSLDKTRASLELATMALEDLVDSLRKGGSN